MDSSGLHLDSIWSPSGVHRHFGSEFTMDHAEALKIEFDPSIVTYAELVDENA